ncbi:MAG: elongation factor P [Thermoguttaceae bacterium]|nr:elongation factor P [Thermoguttaceae bacterium]MBO7722865.1 elongation factor P [Thermoguttaceae bacterium]MBR3219493.1 elongation factor P [Thermoguttaceae bacterium]
MIAKDMKRGDIIVQNGQPIIVENVQVQTPSARGAATLYKFRCRNLITKDKVDLKTKGTDMFEDADFRKRAVSFSYADGSDVHFMDKEDYNDYAIAKEDVANEMQFVTDGLDGIYALIYEERCVAIDLPAAVDLKVVECDPAARGNSATSRSKPAKVETGLSVMVPEYLENGEIIKIDTRTGEFLGRSK